jgi:hypothetical protein
LSFFSFFITGLDLEKYGGWGNQLKMTDVTFNSPQNHEMWSFSGLTLNKHFFVMLEIKKKRRNLRKW